MKKSTYCIQLVCFYWYLLVKNNSSRQKRKLEDLEVWPEKYLPVVCVSAQNLSTIKKLRQSPLVRYVEPIGYYYTAEPHNHGGSELQSIVGFGCTGALPYSGNLLPGIDYNLISPSAKASKL